MHKYGPHIYHTNSREVFEYLSSFTEWRSYQHRVLAHVDGQLVPIPINLDTINKLYGLTLTSFQVEEFFKSVAEPVEQIFTSEDVVVSKVGRELYEKFFRGYTRKQWGLDPSELDASVTARVPTRTNRDDRYFTDSYQAMPLHGFTRMFKRMLDHPNIHVMLNTDYREIEHELRFREMIYTGPVDAFFDFRHGKLPAEQQARARTVGLAMAMGTRILLLSLSWVIGLTAPLFSVFGHEVSGRDLVLLLGGLFLIGKSTHEIHGSLEGSEEHRTTRAAASFMSIIIQIALLDIVFSLDSVTTAVGMVDQIGVMVAAVVIAVGFMMFASGAISGFVDRHPTVKMLALSCLLMIGVMLIAEGFGRHIPKGYIYFAMAFSVFVEMLNLKIRKRSKPVDLHEAL